MAAAVSIGSDHYAAFLADAPPRLCRVKRTGTAWTVFEAAPRMPNRCGAPPMAKDNHGRTKKLFVATTEEEATRWVAFETARPYLSILVRRFATKGTPLSVAEIAECCRQAHQKMRRDGVAEDERRRLVGLMFEVALDKWLWGLR